MQKANSKATIKKFGSIKNIFEFRIAMRIAWNF